MKKSSIDNLVDLCFDDNAPDIVKYITIRQLKKTDNESKVIGRMMRDIISSSADIAESFEKRDLTHVCKNCIHCNLRRAECDMDAWWNIDTVDIHTKYCDKFSN